MNTLRRLPISRLLLLIAAVLAVGISATAIALAVGGGAKPPQKPLAQAVHDALSAPAVEGVSANVTLTNHLIEGASLASSSGQGAAAAASPLLAGASGRLWIAKDGRMRLELQAEKGDTQIVYDGHTISMYDAASNTLYRYTPPASEQPETTSPHAAQAPSVTKIEEAIAHLSSHATVTSTPENVAGRPAYTVRVSPKEGGSLLAGSELSFDAANGAPLRAAVYSTTSSSPVIELAATEASFGAVSDSVFSFTPPANAKVQEVKAPGQGAADTSHNPPAEASGERPKLTTHGHGPATIAVLEAKAGSGKAGTGNSTIESLPKVSINGVQASELRTELGTILTFERAGVRYVLAGSDSPAAIEALARGL